MAFCTVLFKSGYEAQIEAYKNNNAVSNEENGKMYKTGRGGR